MAKVTWVKAHAEQGGAETNDHEKQNKKADEDAEGAYVHLDSLMYRWGYCSQFDTLYGATIDGKVVTHKMGVTVPRYLQTTQYLPYWKTRTGTGGWADNSDIKGHAAACRRERKGNPKQLPCVQYKEMNSRHPTSDTQHQINHRYDPATLATEQAWVR